MYEGFRALARWSVWDHLAWLDYMRQVTGATVMKADLRPMGRTPPWGWGGGQSRVPGSWLGLKQGDGPANSFVS